MRFYILNLNLYVDAVKYNCDRSILLYVYVYVCINLYTVAFDNCFLKNKR